MTHFVAFRLFVFEGGIGIFSRFLSVISHRKQCFLQTIPIWQLHFNTVLVFWCCSLGRVL